MADTGIRQWEGRLYWRGGIFQRCRNLFKIGGGADFVKLLTGGGGGGCVQSLTTGGGGGAVPYDGGGGGQSTFGTQKIRFANRYSITERA